MIDAIAHALEPLVWQVARQTFGRAANQRAPLQAAVAELSRIYTLDRAGITRAAADPALRLARLVFFTLADVPKAVFPLAELAGRNALPLGRLKVLDVGAGYGAMTLGLVGLLEQLGGQHELEVDAVDSDGAALQLLRAVLQAHDGAVQPRVTLYAQDAARAGLPAGPYDLILAGTLLNELPPTARLPLVEGLLGRLTPRGHLVLVEPALRDCARELHTLRDALVRREGTTLFAPCTHQGPCPALCQERDWCHEHRIWQPPPLLRELAAGTGLRRRDIKWSYLTLNRHGAALADPTGTPGAAPLLRVVSAPLKSKGKLERILCGPAGWVRAVRLKRHRGAENRAFERLGRGHLVQLSGPPALYAPADPSAPEHAAVGHPPKEVPLLRLEPGLAVDAADPAELVLTRDPAEEQEDR